MDSNDTRTFSLFPLFPVEIRLLIWSSCLPRRVVEIDNPAHFSEWDPLRTCTLSTTTRTNSRPPVISRVCREAREVASRAGGWTWKMIQVTGVGGFDAEEGEGDSPPPYYYQFSKYRGDETWIQPGRDEVVHLHWTPATHVDDFAESWTEMEKRDRAVELLWWLRRRMRIERVSIVADVVCPFRGDWVRLGNVAIQDTEAVVALGREVPVGGEYEVVLEMVTVHVRLDAAVKSGLFGVAGDERVKLVGVDDWDGIERFAALWREYGSGLDEETGKLFEEIRDREAFTMRVEKWRRDVIKPWIWHQWRACRWKEDLPVDRVWKGRNRWVDAPGPAVTDAGLPTWDPNGERRWGIDIEVREPNEDDLWVKEELENMPRFVPKIMFRLCGGECYLPEPERPRLRWRLPSPPGRGRGRGGARRRSPPWPQGWPPRHVRN